MFLIPACSNFKCSFHYLKCSVVSSPGILSYQVESRLRAKRRVRKKGRKMKYNLLLLFCSLLSLVLSKMILILVRTRDYSCLTCHSFCLSKVFSYSFPNPSRYSLIHPYAINSRNALFCTHSSVTSYYPLGYYPLLSCYQFLSPFTIPPLYLCRRI